MLHRRALWILLTVTLTPALANAQEYDLTRTWIRCTAFNYSACAQLSIRTTGLAGGGTRVGIGITNLQGSSPFDTSVGSLIRTVIINAPPGSKYGQQNDVFSYEIDGQARGPEAIAPGIAWQLSEIGSSTQDQIRMATPGTTLSGGILGADVDFYASRMTGLEAQTPTAQSSIWFEFLSLGRWNASEMEFLAFAVVSSVEAGNNSCNINIAQTCVTHSDVLVDNLATAPSTVPEPATLIMLGSGLAGLIGAWRRKRASLSR